MHFEANLKHLNVFIQLYHMCFLRWICVVHIIIIIIYFRHYKCESTYISPYNYEIRKKDKNKSRNNTIIQLIVEGMGEGHP